MDDGKFEYFMSQTNKKLDETQVKIDQLQIKIDQLISFRILLIGAAVGISGLMSIMFNLVVLWAK